MRSSNSSSTSWLPEVGPGAGALSPDGGAANQWVEVRFGLGSLPYLADHGFRGLIVIPGAFYVGLVRHIHRQFFGKEALCLAGIQFERPVILTDEDVTLSVRAESRPGGGTRYEIFEGAGAELQAARLAEPCARMVVESEPPTLAPVVDVVTSSVSTDAGAFYAHFHLNGNHYGPAFQILSDISREHGEAVANLSKAGDELSPPMLDAASQLLASFAHESGRTFILKGIERLELAVSPAGPPARVRAVRGGDLSGGEAAGAVQILDATGAVLARLSGVTLAFLDGAPAGDELLPAPTELWVAGTFTTEPLEDSLRFWGDFLQRPVRVKFTPYNQVFQQLLDPASAFRRHRDGANLAVLNLEDWLPEDRHRLRLAEPAKATAAFGDRPRATLPNGLEVVELNRYETDYVYQEIFEDQSYLRHGIRLADGDTVVDIGANIGLFSLFVLSQCRDAKIYAYEPSPKTYELLRANCAAYGEPGRVHPFNCGVADRKGEAQFTFYEHSSVFSSFHPDAEEDRVAVQAVVRNVLEQELSGGGADDADVEDLTTDRLRAQTIACPLTSVSDIIRENGLARIHLLKIDAEKSELQILQGIEEAHWPLIEQLVLEVHDRSRAAVEAIETQLTARGFRCAVVEERLLEDSGLFNIYATRRAPAEGPDRAAEGLTQKVEEFSAALDSFAGASSSPLILAIAPRAAGPEKAALDAAENTLLARAARHGSIRAIGSAVIRARSGVREWHDPHSHQLGHIPYTPEGYAAIGTAASRALFQLSAPPIKVIALDCDNTLWEGQVGEDGPEGVRITEPYRRMQEFILAQRAAGVLLVLCSKNREADALAVFERHAEMPLRREHLAGWQINWKTKAENLRALAQQLGLGLNSFVLLDDNPLECASVRAACPEVLVLQLPAEAARLPQFLESVWIFDHAGLTEEDRARSQWYRANAAREEERTAAPTLRDFLDGLELQIEVSEMEGTQLARVAQLTVRTNQFNFTGVRRTEEQLREFLRAGARCLVTTVRDRFGDYGLVGATLYTAAADRFVVDTFLLSCRALGKGVEHRMLAELASRAVSEGRSSVVLPYRRTERNEPARAFLEELGALAALDEATLELPAATLAQCRYQPEEAGGKIGVVSAPASGTPRDGWSRPVLTATMQRLGDDFRDTAALLAAMEKARSANAPAAMEDALPEGSSLERSLAGIWRKALSRAQIGLSENFFEAGGTSLKAVVVVAMIRKELKRTISIVTLFECPTIKSLAARLDENQHAAESSAAAATAESRGRQRRHHVVKRRVA